MEEWVWTPEETACLTLRISAGHLGDIARDLSYLGLEGLDGIIDTIIRAKVALQNIADSYEECDC